MIPILYAAEETDFNTNGIGRLSDCISCIVTEERNGVYECEFQYPVSGVHFSEITEGCIIACVHDDKKDIQPFDIYARSAPINGIVTFYAHHISYRLGNIILKSFTASSCAQAFARIVPNSINNNPFTFWTDKSVAATFKNTVPSSVKARLGGEEGSILDTYKGGDYEWDRWTVKLYEHRGQDSGVEVRYGKNLVDITQEIDTSESYSVVAPYWADPEKRTIVTLQDYFVVSDVTSLRTAIWHSHKRQTLYARTDDILNFRYALYIAVPMDLSDAFDEMPTQEQLYNEAKRRLENSNAWLPTENITVNFVALWQTKEYADVAPLQRVSLCDTVSVIYPALGIQAIKMRVIKVVYNVLAERYDEIELGEPKTSFADLISQGDKEYVDKNAVTISTMQRAINQATALISGAVGGYRVDVYNADGQPVETLYMDTDDVNTAVNVLRINQNGIGFSHNGVNGPFETAWTIDGSFVADFITAGTLSANRISGGVLSSDETGNYWNLLTGEFWSGDNQHSIAVIDGYVYIYNKSIQDDYIGRISAVNENLNIVTGGKGLGLSRYTGGATQTILLIRNGETGTGYTEDAICFNKWRFIGNVYYMSQVYMSAILNLSAALKLGDNTLTPFSTTVDNVAYHGFRTATDDFVLIGTTAFNKNYRMRVAGGTLYVDQTMSAQTVTQRSDERLKDIEQWDDRYLAVLDKIEPIVYHWKQEGKEGKQYVGIGARKTKAILEEAGLIDSGLVQGEEEDGLTVSYSDLTCMLLKKVQEQQKQINDLQKRLERLEGLLCS